MGRLPTGRRKYEIKCLKIYHVNILKRLVLGHKPKDIARDWGISTQTICNLRNSTVGRKMLAKMNFERDMETIMLIEPLLELRKIMTDLDSYPTIKQRAEEITAMLESKVFG